MLVLYKNTKSKILESKISEYLCMLTLLFWTVTFINPINLMHSETRTLKHCLKKNTEID
jgi:hypothetical protein